jgi:hypothetical protein
MQGRATVAQLKEEVYKEKVEELTTALIRAITLRGNGSGGPGGNYKRISMDPKKFSGTEKVISKRQQQYLTWRSQLLSVFRRDKHIFNTEYLQIQCYDRHRSTDQKGIRP